MKPDIHLAPAYRVIRLMDLNIPHPEIAARTGFDEDYVSGIETWSRENADFLSQARGELTATEALVLGYLLQLTVAPDRDERTPGVFGVDDVVHIAEAFGAETTSEIAEVLDSLAEKGFFEPFAGAKFADIFSDDNEAGVSQAGGQPGVIRTRCPLPGT